MPLGTALAVTSALAAGGKYLASRYALAKRKKFEDTEFGREQARIAKEGRYTPKARGMITGSVARKAGATAQTGKASFAGRLAAQGLEGSIAGQRGLNEFDIAKQEQVAGAAREVDLANETSKVDAKLSYAENKLRDRREREAMKAQGTQQLIGDLGNVVSQYISGSAQEKQAIARNVAESAKDERDFRLKILEMTNGMTKAEIEEFERLLENTGLVEFE